MAKRKISMFPTAILAGVVLIHMFGVTPAGAQEQTIALTSTEITTYTPSEETLGKYYTLRIEGLKVAPGKRLEKAVLEIYVDVGSKERNEYVNDTPVLQVCALKSDLTGELAADKLDLSSASVRPLTLGTNKRVLIDVTPIIKLFLKNPSANHGLVIGSLTWTREGDFALKSGGLTNGVMAQIHLQYSQ